MWKVCRGVLADARATRSSERVDYCFVVYSVSEDLGISVQLVLVLVLLVLQVRVLFTLANCLQLRQCFNFQLFCVTVIITDS